MPNPITRRTAIAVSLGYAILAAASGALAQTPRPVEAVATFSILRDLVAQVGGERVALTSLVQPEGDAHVYAPTPADAQTLAKAKVIFTNGLGFEGWLERLIASSGTRARVVTASKGVKALEAEEEDTHAKGHAHGAGGDKLDPHAWQSVGNVKIYVANIRDALVEIDPEGRTAYEANAKTFLASLETLETDVRTAVASIPKERRRVITSHDAFTYFSAAYGMAFIAPQGVSTESEASAKDVARIISQIKREKIPAVFVENISDPRLITRIAKETGARIGDKVYSDSLSAPDGPAGTYIAMIRHNITAFTKALSR